MAHGTSHASPSACNLTHTQTNKYTVIYKTIRLSTSPETIEFNGTKPILRLLVARLMVLESWIGSPFRIYTKARCIVNRKTGKWFFSGHALYFMASSKRDWEWCGAWLTAAAGSFYNECVINDCCMPNTHTSYSTQFTIPKNRRFRDESSWATYKSVRTINLGMCNRVAQKIAGAKGGKA